MQKEIEAKVECIVNDLLKETNIELVDIEYVREKNWYLRVFIDKEGGIDIDDCKMLSEELEQKLDEENLISNSYQLEVSSPGLDRVLKKERDFMRECGKVVDVTLYESSLGEKNLTGVLKSYDGKNIFLDTRKIPLTNIAQIRLHLDF